MDLLIDTVLEYSKVVREAIFDNVVAKSNETCILLSHLSLNAILFDLIFVLFL